MSRPHHIGQRLSFDDALCTVRYIGDVAGTSGSWLGVEWDDASRGKHDGRHKNERYFECLSNSPTAASFVRPTRRADEPRSFVAAVLQKYATDSAGDAGAGSGSGSGSGSRNPEIDIVYFGKKVAEEVGFDKIRRQLARVDELKIVILDGMRIAWDVQFDDAGKTVKGTSPLVAELDLSRNLFETFGTVVRICRELGDLKNLRLNGNRFQLLHEGEQVDDVPSPAGANNAFPNVDGLELEETLLSWDSICDVASDFPRLSKLSASLNELSSLQQPAVGFGSLAQTLTTLSLEFNDFASLADLAPLASLGALKSLHLKGNAITCITPSPDVPPPIFGPALVFLDVSYNAIASWSFVDALPSSAPGLTALRINHNPIYDNPDAGTATSASTGQAGSGGSNSQPSKPAKPTEEAYMFTIARLPNLKSVNFTPITAQERTNAELFYLSRIARQLAAVPEDEEATVLGQHPLYAALCDAYGEPDVVRRDEVNPNFLEARLVTVKLKFVGGGGDGDSETPRNPEEAEGKGSVRFASTEIPRSFDVYSVKGIAGKLFGVRPLSLKLVWETGEWDPVGGFDEEVGDSSDDDEYEGRGAAAGEWVEGAAGGEDGPGHLEDDEASRLGKTGRWVEREVELVDGPRQLGFCVDGLEVTIRVEVR